MRNSLCSALIRQAARKNFVFLTGDLGYNALEPLRDVLGDRFINAGISEQNMVGMAAGLAKAGLEPWCYSIAPFIFARPFEQIRNDVCLHRLPVRLVGNGGGYGYGVMGSTHHAIEDYGALLCLQHMQVFVPAFAEDVLAQVEKSNTIPDPIYFRLGRDEKPSGFLPAPYAPWRRLVQGEGPVALYIGPIVGPTLALAVDLPIQSRPTIWLVSELPVTRDSIPGAFIADVNKAGDLIVCEEHVRHGGVGETLGALLLTMDAAPRHYRHRFAAGYPSGRYGSQEFHRRESGIDAQSLLQEVVRQP